MADLKDLLERRARRFRPANDEDGFGRLLDRADRRHAHKRITAGVVALAVAVVGSLGVYAMLGRGTTGRPSDGAAFAAEWPQKGLADAQVAQARANANDPGLTWQQDAEKFLWQFGNDGLSWVRTTIPHVSETDANGDGPLTVSIHGAPADQCTYPNDAPDWVCPEDAFTDALVTIQRLVEPGPKGIWSVTSAVVDGASVSLPNSPLPPVDTNTPGSAPTAEIPPEVEAFVQQFMDSRMSGSDFAVNHLATTAATSYHSGEGGLELYGYTRQAGATWQVNTRQNVPDTDRWIYVIEIQGDNPPFPASGSIQETLTVGSPGDGAPLVILAAERNE